MAQLSSQRQAATPRGLHRRIDDLAFAHVADPRSAPHTRFALPALLASAVLAVASGARSLRHVENRTEQMRTSTRDHLQLYERVADNTFTHLLPRLEPYELRLCLHRAIKAEKRRGNLKPTRLSRSTVAIDGKHLITLQWDDLVRLTRLGWRQAHKDEPERYPPPPFDADEREPTLAEVWAVVSNRFPQVQWQTSNDGTIRGLVRVHRATLVSSAAAVCVDQNMIAGKTNEVGTIQASVWKLLTAYRHTDLVERVTVDAGNVSLAVATQLHRAGVDYFLRLGENQGLHKVAVEALEQTKRRADLVAHDHRAGKHVVYSVWCHPLEAGHGKWSHARQLVRIERLTVGDDPASLTEGNRYFVSSESPGSLPSSEALTVCRMYWRCENEGHWTSDAILKEHARRTPWSRHPVGVEVSALLRMMAQNVVALLRSLSRYRRDGQALVKPSWKEVLEHVLLVMFAPNLETGRFDACEV